jgi:hypothetical protein
MDTTHLTSLLRALATTPSRRGVARTLIGSALASALSPLLGPAQAEAKRNKKKRQKKKCKDRPPCSACAGRNFCVDPDTGLCNNVNSDPCYCFVTAETGEPFCALESRTAESCAECDENETCIDPSGGVCAGVLGCALPCPNQL